MKGQKCAVFCGAAGMLFMILDTGTAISAASEGVGMCIRQLIPSLFPFLVMSGFLIDALQGSSLPFLRPLERLCRIRPGSGSILLTGLLGGYPVGARGVYSSFRAGNLTKEEAERMLGFCSNAGPSFIFGMVAAFFENPMVPWVMWGIHILSALLTGILLPGSSGTVQQIGKPSGISVTNVLEKAVKTMAVICGWVILFRVILRFLNRWVLWMMPPWCRVLVSGILELSNGCLMLENVRSLPLRFFIAGVMLTFGGLCVAMQTMAICGELGIGSYLKGKVLQTVIFFALSVLFLMMTEGFRIWFLLLPALLVCLVIMLPVRKLKKHSSISGKIGV